MTINTKIKSRLDDKTCKITTRWSVEILPETFFPDNFKTSHHRLSFYLNIWIYKFGCFYDKFKAY